MAPVTDHPGEQPAQDPIKLIAIRDTALSVDEILRAVGDDAAGGTALFVGTVRNHDGGVDVDELGYSCHPSAEDEMRRIAEKVAADFPVRALAAAHRVGDLRVGDLAVVAAVSCAHRGEAFEACRLLRRRHQARGADLEAPALLRRHGGVGRRLTRLPSRCGMPFPCGTPFRAVA